MSRTPASPAPTRPSSGRPSPLSALLAALIALAVAAAVNAALAVVAGEVLVIPGELGVGQIVTFTLAMVLPAAVTLWVLPRYFAWIAIAVAVLTIPFPVAEFGSPVALWLSAMHLIAGVSAAVIAPRVLALLAARGQTAGASS